MSLETFLVCLAAFAAGAVNAIAGGGTFISFPALTAFARLNEKVANMTSTIGLWPGSAASVAAARDDFRRLPRRLVLGYSALSLVGGVAGAVLLRYTSAKAFSLVIPWLLLFATLVFAFGKRLARWARREAAGPGAGLTGKGPGRRRLGWAVLFGSVQFALAVYGGYFGAGVGILTMAGLAFMGMDDLHQLNALKVLLVTLINGAAAAVFLFDQIDWRVAGLMAVASIVGGFLGMDLSRRIPQAWLRATVLVAGGALTAVYFVKNYL